MSMIRIFTNGWKVLNKARHMKITPSSTNTIWKGSYCTNVAATSSVSLNPKNISMDPDFMDIETEKYSLSLAKVWLRDHCRCKKCFDSRLLQRKVSINSLNLDVDVKSVDIIEDEQLKITWNDGHESEYSLDWLKTNTFPGQQIKIPKMLWNTEIINKEKDVPVVTYNDFMETEEGVKSLLQSILKYGFGFLVESPSTPQATNKAGERICFLHETFYGKSWVVETDLTRADKSYTNLGLGAHTDFAFGAIPAGIQILTCLHHDGEGGESLLVDGFYCAEKVRKNYPMAFDLLKDIKITHEYLEPARSVYLSTLAPLLNTHPITDELIWVRYNEFDRAPFSSIPQNQVSDYYRALKLLADLFESDRNQYWFKIQPGTILFMDNWRVLHGRASYTGRRKMCGTYLPREYWIGKAKHMGLV